ncbi:M56 family metallopeptidase [Aquimarina sp. 2304DJ70-9]|uniref:M56 family metallopeptidase n=1 Tax=Aquimarina penaris TaxID=3231044 RepID=UPI0034627D07
MLLLWGFYILFLERENMHYTKRFYLLFSLVFACTIPLITFTYTTNISVEPEIIEAPLAVPVIMSEQVPVVTPSIDYLSLLLWSIYGIGVLIFGFRFIKNIKNLTQKINTNERLKESSHINVLVSDTFVPHTFLKYIFLPKKEYQEKNIPKEVLLHEKTHVIQKHTLDILFVEMLQILFWFNPLLFWIKKSIKLNHEFLADQTVLKRQFSLQNYMNLLVTYPNNSNQVELSSPINYSLTKKRIVMMSKQFSKTRAAARLLLLLPILLGCMLLFNNEIVAQQKSINYTKTIQDTHPDKKIKIRVKNEQITLNGTATTLANFASVIDEKTKQWKDNELTEFQFDIQILESDDGFVEKLNDEYRKTRLYNANPDGHDLIPPAPPIPEIPNIEMDVIPSPPPAPNVKVEKDVIISPAPPKTPSPPVYPDVEIDEIEEYIEEARIEADQAREVAVQAGAMAREEAQRRQEETMRHVYMAREQAEHAREAAEHARALAMETAHRAHDKSHRQRDLAMRHAEMSRLEAEKVREMAIHEARIAREEVMLHRDKIREEARAAAEEARKQAEKVRREVLEDTQKIRKEARKAAEAARKEARKEMEKARKKREKARKKAEKERN